MSQTRSFPSVLAGAWRLLLLVTPLAFGGLSVAGQVMLQEPDFSGLFSVSDGASVPLMRDSARGWTYFGNNSGTGASVDGIAFSGWLFRVSDSGVADTHWRLPAEFQITDQYLAADGAPVVQAYVKNSPTYERRWYRLPRDSVGLIAPLEVSNTDDLPARDSVRLDSNPTNRPLPVRSFDGSTVTLDVSFAPVPPYTSNYTLRKRSARGDELWSRTIRGNPHNIAMDTRGRAYVLGEALNIGERSGNLLRVLGDGTVDVGWNPDIDITQYVVSTFRVVSDRAVVADFVGGNPSVNRLTSFNLLNGGKVAQRFTRYSLGAIGEDGVATSGAADGRWSLLDTLRSDESHDRLSAARVGSWADVQAVIRWRDGYVIGGNFAYWFDGKLYRNLMRLDAEFRPDPTWPPQALETVSALAVDTQQRLVVATRSASKLNGSLTRFDESGVLDSAWRPLIAGGVFKLLAASDGMLFVGGAFSAVDGVARGSIARFRPDGALDVEWARESPLGGLNPAPLGQFGRDGIYTILDAGADGVYFIWEDGYMNGSVAGVGRLSREGVGAKLSVPSSVDSAPEYATGGVSMLRDPANGAIYAIASAWQLPPVATTRGTALVRMLPPQMEIDASWTTLAGEYGRQFHGFAYQTEAHIYVCRGGSVRRFDKVTGTEDPGWSSNEVFWCTATFAERTPDGVTLSAPSVSILARVSDRASNEASPVVEDYARSIQRFFITSRPSEIAQLDALPGSFSRTGMRFGAVSARVRSSEASSAAICRFYAAPAKGGSNTHFYGSGDDCVMVKRFPLLSYEGFDFRAGAPTNGVCPAATPDPVHRLFNNRVSTNDGNHRYVVKDARRNEMMAAGWVDEGVVFCVADAVDSKPLIDIVQ